MKDLSASATGTTPAPIERAYAVITDYERYPDWYPAAVHGSEILERDGGGEPTKVKVTLYANVGPFNREFKLHLAVTTRDNELVDLKRLPKSHDDREEMQVTFRLAEAGDGTQVTVELSARLSLPPFFPTGGLPEKFARGFLDAALSELR